jgi:DNA mismatch endonuclease (patch repair protein)
MMSGIKSTNTKPEMIVRRGLHRLGFRYHLHERGLPGTPDVVLPRYRAVLFINGCFWHGHDCHLFKWPSSREAFWRAKILTNRANDEMAAEALSSAGWRVCTVWECALKGRTRKEPSYVIDQLELWLRGPDEMLTIQGNTQDDMSVTD